METDDGYESPDSAEYESWTLEQQQQWLKVKEMQLEAYSIEHEEPLKKQEEEIDRKLDIQQQESNM